LTAAVSQFSSFSAVRIFALKFKLELCVDELVVGGGVGWVVFFIGGGRVALWSAAAASDRMREH